MKDVYSEVQTLLAEAGFPKVLSVSNRLEAITALCVHSVILSRKAELDQFAVGLGPVLGLAKKYPDVLKSLFVNCSEPGSASVTPAEFKGLLVFEGLQDKVKEYFLEYIDREGRTYYRYLLFIGETTSKFFPNVWETCMILTRKRLLVEIFLTHN